MSDTKSNTQQEIREMAKLTVLSNKINEVQEQNLKMFALIFFNGVKSAKIDYDLSRVKSVEDEPAFSPSYVSYDLTMEENAQNPNQDKRFAALEKAVRNLFWAGVNVEVYFNGSIVFKSKKNV